MHWKLGIAVVSAAMGLVLSSPASAQLYLRGDAGWSWSQDAGDDLNDDVGSSYVFGAGIGYRFNRWLRSDVSGHYRGDYGIDNSMTAGGRTGAFKGDVSSVAGMFNVYADLVTWGLFTPYVGGGVGVARNEVDDLEVRSGGQTGRLEGDHNYDFAWQAGGGVGIQVLPKLLVDVGYRYVDLGKARTGTTGTLGNAAFSGPAAEGDLRAHEVGVGLRLSF
jgi:opacity protein-like surface antigen